jgi:hypothetical protein
MPPLVCPPPKTVSAAPDCPLYEDRLPYSADEPLRRAILMERPGPDLADLIRAEPVPASEPAASSPPAALPAPEPMPSPILDQLRKEAQ